MLQAPKKPPKNKFTKYWGEFLFTNFSLPMLLSATVQYGYGSGEELFEYLTDELGMDEGGAEMVVSTFSGIDV